MMPSMLSIPVQGEGTSYGTHGRLPIEIRNEIYTLLLGKCWNLIRPARSKKISRDLGIMAASKKISSEALEAFFAKSIFFLNSEELCVKGGLLPADRLVNAQRMRSLELRHVILDYEPMRNVYSSLPDGCNYQNAGPYLVSLLDRGPVDQEFRLQLMCVSGHGESKYEDMLNESISACKILCPLKKVVVWLYEVYRMPSEEEEKPEINRCFEELNSRLQPFLGPSQMEKGLDERSSFSGILKFRPREHQAKLCGSQH